MSGWSHVGHGALSPLSVLAGRAGRVHKLKLATRRDRLTQTFCGKRGKSVYTVWRTAMMALHPSGVAFANGGRRSFNRGRDGSPIRMQRLPQHPSVAFQKRGERRRYRSRLDAQHAALQLRPRSVVGDRPRRSLTSTAYLTSIV
jgi:hypothetical protein